MDNQNETPAPVETVPYMVVAKPFTLTFSHNEKYNYGVGVHQDVPKTHAEHWYSQLFLAGNERELPSPQNLTLEEALKSNQEYESKFKDALTEMDRLRSQVITLSQASGEAGLLKERLTSAESERDSLAQKLQFTESERDRLKEELTAARSVPEAASEDAADVKPKTAKGAR